MKDLGRAAAIKACCAAVYGSDLMQILLGGRLHPGDEELTRRLADLVGVGPGERVLDVASGLGSTARLLAAERGATVLGVDLSPRLVEAARREAVRVGLDHVTAFEVGDAERLPVSDACFDIVVCECALCTFPDQATAVAELRRVLRPGGRIGIADVTLDRDRLPPELDTPIGRVICVAGARSALGYERLLREGGFADVVVEGHAEGALGTVDSIRIGLEAARDALDGLFDVGAALWLVDLARDAVREGAIGYALIAATAREAEPAAAVGGVDGAIG